MMSALPPRSGESPRRGTSRLEMMQARFQAKQLEEKEEKMIHLLEEKQERTIQRVNYGRDSANSTNSFSSSASSNSVNGGIGMRPPMYGGTGGGGGGRVRQMFDQRRGAGSPVGWDKSYPLDPVNTVNTAVEAVNPEVVRTPLYKQNVARTNSYNKYSGNYGPRAGGGHAQYGKRGMSLDRSKGGRGDSRLGYTGAMSRAHSQANIGSSSEDSYPGSRPYSGLGYTGSGSGNLRARKPSGSGSQTGLMTRSGYAGYGGEGGPVSPEDSPPAARKSYGSLSRERDYTRPLPPAYRRQKSMSRMTEPSPSRHSYHQDSAYSSHSSQSSDNHSASNSAFSVISSVSSPAVNRPPLSTQSSPSKSYSRQNSFNYDPSRTINSRTFRKQKSPVRHRSPSISPSRSAENSDETDLAVNDDYGTAGSRGVSRNAERAREEERRRMQVEMRKREQELLAKIKEQQKELDLVKADKAKVEKELTRAEREREDERRMLEAKEREMEIQRKEDERRERQEVRRQQQPPASSYERVLTREKASPAHLRGRRPPSLVSSENDEEVKMINTAGLAAPTTITIPITKMSEDDVMLSSVKPPALVASDRESVSPQRSAQPPARPGDSASLQRRNSLRRPGPRPEASVNRSGSFRIKKENYEPKPRVPQSPSLQRREPPKVPQSPSAQRKVPQSPSTQRRVPQSPSLRRREPSPKPTITRESLRRKAAESDSWAKEDNKASASGVQAVQARSSASLGLSRLRGPSREPSFDDDKESVASVTNSRSGAKTRTTTYISPAAANSRNSSDSLVKDAKKSVPPSPAPKKKTPSTPARKSIFAPKPRDDLTACRMCGRNFADDRIEKHEEICAKTAEKAKKRKVFDMTKARVKGTDAAKYVKSAAHLEKKEAKEQKKSDWRKKREDFIATLRAAKEAQKHLAAGGSLKDLPPPPPMDTSDYIQCPHCSRRFAEAAAERHIPKCKDIKSNKRR